MLSNKLLQGDIIEHPLFILENKWKIDFKYYLTNQIEKPVFQIFELVMKNPESIIVDLVRKVNNAKSGNHSITAWLELAGQKKKEENKKEVNIDIEKLKQSIQNIDEDENLLEDQFDEIEDSGEVEEDGSNEEECLE
jgi:hypothetical protein